MEALDKAFADLTTTKTYSTHPPAPDIFVKNAEPPAGCCWNCGDCVDQPGQAAPRAPGGPAGEDHSAPPRGGPQA